MFYMSTDMDIRFWYNNNQVSIDERFLAMVEWISKWPQISTSWQGLQALERNVQKAVLDVNKELSFEEMKAAVRGYNKETYCLSTGIGFKCWRFKGDEVSPGYARIHLQVWGIEYAKRHFRDPRIEGDASIFITPVGPYCMVLDPPVGFPEDVNNKVAENLSDLTDMLFGLIDETKPISMKVFVEEAKLIPFNAHMVYFMNESMIIEDLKLIHELWEQGMSSYYIEPLRSADPVAEAITFHPWRKPALRQKVKQQLAEAISYLPYAREEAVRQVIASGMFDNYTMPIGVTVLEYPDFMNSLLDDFYIAVLHASKPQE